MLDLHVNVMHYPLHRIPPPQWGEQMEKQMVSTQEWIETALGGESVWNIGQIDDATARALNKLVKQGRLAKSRLSWCGISALRTVWHLPNMEPLTGAELYAHDEGIVA